jgi:hypothetical protein
VQLGGISYVAGNGREDARSKGRRRGRKLAELSSVVCSKQASGGVVIVQVTTPSKPNNTMGLST